MHISEEEKITFFPCKPAVIFSVRMYMYVWERGAGERKERNKGIFPSLSPSPLPNTHAHVEKIRLACESTLSQVSLSMQLYTAPLHQQLVCLSDEEEARGDCNGSPCPW